ncbi:hypothetical protein [Lapillicoccus sp.]|uniref:hypothetical protein n=1 Tax=Lapillicoccus sp. TaxID=1909287 RepID=UPI003263A7C9
MPRTARNGSGRPPERALEDVDDVAEVDLPRAGRRGLCRPPREVAGRDDAPCDEPERAGVRAGFDDGRDGMGGTLRESPARLTCHTRHDSQRRAAAAAAAVGSGSGGQRQRWAAAAVGSIPAAGVND